jgi:sugar phosphate isomerase/epimerase
MKIMKIGYLTAAVQTPPGTSSEMFVKDPTRASVLAASMHLNWAADNKVPVVELGCALAPPDANVPPESMADLVAHHTAVRTFKNGTGIEIEKSNVQTLVEAARDKVAVGTLGTFENLLSENPVIRRQNIEHTRRAIRTAAILKEAGLGTEGVTIFVGRNLTLPIEENMRLFAEVVIPIIRYAKEHGVIIFIENCPMCGWSGRDVFTQNIANTPLHWIMMARIVEAAGLRGWCFINHDPSHDILQGFRPEWSYKVMKKAGFGWFIGRFHSKDLSRQSGLIAMSGFLGQRVMGGGWNMMDGDQPIPGATEQNVYAMADGRQVHWLGSQIAARRDLELDVENTTLTVEFEQSEFRNPKHFANQQQHWDVAMAMVLGSIRFMTGIETAAAANVELEKIVLANNTAEHPKTWSWQPDEVTLVGTDKIIKNALKWELPPISKTSDFVLGSDLAMAA